MSGLLTSFKPLFAVSTGRRGLSSIYARGSGVFGALSLDNNLRDVKTFQEIPWKSLVVDPKDHEIARLSAGWGHSTALTTSGNLYVWGRPYDFSTLMRLNNINRMSSFLARMAAMSSNSLLFGKSENYGYFPTPRLINQGQGKVTSVSASAGLTAFLTEEGEVYCFGLNRWQQCGITSKTVTSGSGKKQESSDMHIYNPVRVKDVPRCKKIDTGLQHCLALSSNGEVFSWGKGSKGQLGHVSPTTEPSDITSLAKKVPFLDSRGRTIKVKDISAGFAHSAAIAEDGSVYIWGKGMSEKEKANGSGIGEVKVCDDQFTPRLLTLPENRKAKEICSSHFTLVVRAEDDTLWTIGLGEHDRNANPIPLPVQNDFRLTTSATSIPQFPPEIYQLKKGFKRVSIHSNLEHVNTIIEEEEKSNPNGSQKKSFWDFEQRQKYAKSFDIVLHQGEAYLIGLNVNTKLSSDSNSKDEGYIEGSIIDYSNAWQHELLLVR